MSKQKQGPFMLSRKDGEGDDPPAEPARRGRHRHGSFRDPELLEKFGNAPE